MAKKSGKGRGWHGDSKGHADAGRKGGLASRKRKQSDSSTETEQMSM